MAISLDRLAGFHHKALQVRADRMEVIAGNLANANTPGYKAKDIDFQKAMSMANAQQSGMATTHNKHFNVNTQSSQDMMYSIPNQPDTGDGNTVDVQNERNKFLETSMRYETSLTLLSGKFSGMKKALSGGQ